MVAGVFAAHGLEYGDSYTTLGYTSYEDKALKRYLKKAAAGIEPPNWVPDPGGVQERAEGLDFFKCSVEFWPAFEGWATPVKIKRDIHAAAQSVADKRGESVDVALPIIEERYRMLDTIPGPTVKTDHVVAGDFTTLRRAFDYCGLNFSASKAREAIDPELWHYSA